MLVYIVQYVHGEGLFGRVFAAVYLSLQLHIYHMEQNNKVDSVIRSVL